MLSVLLFTKCRKTKIHKTMETEQQSSSAIKQPLETLPNFCPQRCALTLT